MIASLSLSFADVGELRTEYEANLRRGRAFVSGASGLSVLDDCQLVIHVVGHPSLHLGARVVMPADQQAALGGVGLSLHAGFEALLAGLIESAAPESEEALAESTADEDEAGAEDDGQGEDEDDQYQDDRYQDDRYQDDQDELGYGDDGAAKGSPDVVDSPITRLSRLTMAEKVKLIRKSQILSERNMLERMLGKSGWEALLQNPRLTIPEVAKLACKGTVPLPTLEKIVDNKAWVAAAPIRRALLRNPKLPRTAIADVLRAVPRRELELMVKGAAYPPAVRDVIRRMLHLKR